MPKNKPLPADDCTKNRQQGTMATLLKRLRTQQRLKGIQSGSTGELMVAAAEGFENVIGDTPLHYAAAYSLVKEARILIKEGAVVEKENRYGCTPLHYAAAFSAEAEMIELLVKAGSSVNFKNKLGETPLHLAAWKKEADVLKLLVDLGANIEALTHEHHTPLYYCTIERDWYDVRNCIGDTGLALLERGADPSSLTNGLTVGGKLTHMDSSYAILFEDLE